MSVGRSTVDGPSGKAAGFHSLLVVIREELGEASFQEWVGRMPADTQEAVRKPPVAAAWMPSVHFHRLIDGYVEHFHQGNTEAAVEVGRRQLMHDMNTIYKVFMQLVSPDLVLKRGASIYETYTRDGRMTSKKTGPNTAEVRWEGVPLRSPAWWAYQRGAVLGVMQCTKVQNLRLEVLGGGGQEDWQLLRVTWG